MIDKNTLARLYAQYRAQSLTEAERAQFRQALHDPANADLLNEVLDEDWSAIAPGELEDVSPEKAEAIYGAVLRTRHTRRLWPRIAAAASILLVCSAGGYFLLRQVPKPEALLPATDGITLTVAHQTIPIAYHHKGQIAQHAHQTDSLIAYQATDEQPQQETLTNNSGHRITVRLADGTEAILDVASTLNYPSAFTGKERRVALNGQAYFKVKHDAGHPFYVDYAGETTEDIGTEFNIHAYADEPASTTLINGSIKVNNTLLKPGEQLTGNQITRANIEAVTAWLQDQMILHNEKLEAIMRDVARIYQVKVIWQYEQSKQFTFGGFVSRSKKLANLLNFMRRTGQVDFRVEGKTIYVIKPNSLNP